MFHHITVLKEEATEGLHIKRDGIYVDCTLGGAGHSSLIASKLGEYGRLIALDQDDWALNNARERLAPYEDKVSLVKTNFRHLEDALKELAVPMKDGIPQVDGILYDLGVSSPQFDEGERGFSYNHDAPLDMRMDRSSDLTAWHIVNEWPEQEIARVLYRHGEEKFSRRIAKFIIEHRKEAPIQTTGQLVDIIKEGIPAAARRTAWASGEAELSGAADRRQRRTRGIRGIAPSGRSVPGARRKGVRHYVPFLGRPDLQANF